MPFRRTLLLRNKDQLVRGIPTPLKNMSSSVGMILPNIFRNKQCCKPPTSQPPNSLFHRCVAFLNQRLTVRHLNPAYFRVTLRPPNHIRVLELNRFLPNSITPNQGLPAYPNRTWGKKTRRKQRTET